MFFLEKTVTLALFKTQDDCFYYVQGIQNVLVSIGPDGSYYASKDKKTITSPAYPIKVLDTTGKSTKNLLSLCPTLRVNQTFKRTCMRSACARSQSTKFENYRNIGKILNNERSLRAPAHELCLDNKKSRSFTL